MQALENDLWDGDGKVKKKSLENLVVRGELGAYRELLGEILKLLDETFS